MEEKRITLLHAADYSNWRGANSGIHSNCLNLERCYNYSYLGEECHRLDYDITTNVYSLMKVKLGISPEGWIIDLDESTIADFDENSKKLTLVDVEAAKDVTFANNNIVVSKFMNIICLNHENAIAGTNVFKLLQNLKNFNEYALYNLLVYYDNIQAIEKLGESFIASIADKDFVLRADARARHQVINLPQQVIRYCESVKPDAYGYYHRRDIHATYLQHFKNMNAKDPNELIYLVNYLELQKKVSKKIPNQNGGSMGVASPGSELELIERLAEIKQLQPDLDLRKVLKFLITQHSMQTFEVGYSNANHDPIRFIVTIPSTMAGIYRDYLRMKGIVELFPQDLYKSHNITTIEAKVDPSETTIRKFNQHGTLLGQRFNKTIGKYRFFVPNDCKEFLRIAKEFHNCLPTSIDDFINGRQNIQFIEVAGETSIRYVVEVNNRGELIQAKTIRDIDISDEDVLDAIDLYIKELNA